MQKDGDMATPCDQPSISHLHLICTTNYPLDAQPQLIFGSTVPFSRAALTCALLARPSFARRAAVRSSARASLLRFVPLPFLLARSFKRIEKTRRNRKLNTHIDNNPVLATRLQRIFSLRPFCSLHLPHCDRPNPNLPLSPIRPLNLSPALHSITAFRGAV